MRFARRSLGFALALLLGACAEMQFLQPLQDLDFELGGRIALQYGDNAGSGNIAWRHGARSDEMLLSSPLGQGIARIVRDGNQVTLTSQDGREHRASDAESLTEQVLGFRLPLVGLADWVRGRAAPAPAAAPTRESRDGEGRLLELEQAGWQIEYQAYEGDRPTRLRVRYPGLELRLAIATWK
jgi:outer membrane lipoprotein LolB